MGGAAYSNVSRPGEADFLPSRALKLAPDNDKVKDLCDEIVKLLQLKTN